MKKTNLVLALGAAMVAGSVMPAFADDAATTGSTEVVRPFETGKNSTPIGTKASEEEFADKALVSVDADKSSLEEVEYHTVENEVGTQSATVYAKVGSSFKVTIPKVIVLKGVRGGVSTATYKVDVDGDIAGDEYVLVQPDATFAMKQTGKADVTADVAQTLVKYRAYNYNGTVDADSVMMAADSEDAIANGEGTGTVSATLTAGKWQGTFNFDIKLMNDADVAQKN